MALKASDIFAWLGVLLGISIIILSLYIINHPAVNRLENDQNDLIISYHEVYEYFLCLLVTGCVLVALNSTGLRQHKYMQVFYRISVIVVSIIVVCWAAIVYKQLDYYKKVVDSEKFSVGLWEVWNVMFPQFINDLEIKYKCCGWYNAFEKGSIIMQMHYAKKTFVFSCMLKL